MSINVHIFIVNLNPLPFGTPQGRKCGGGQHSLPLPSFIVHRSSFIVHRSLGRSAGEHWNAYSYGILCQLITGKQE
jgi:hypothetical protein